MPNGDSLPLLRLARSTVAERARRPRGFPRIHRPDHPRQRERIEPQLGRLVEALDARRMALQEDLAGVEPELAVVFEIIGTVEEFYRAVEKVPGMEWLGEYEERDLAPDEDFYSTADPEKRLTPTLFLVMTDRRAVEELLRLWALYREDEKARFPRGLAKFRQVFQLLREVRPWGPRDRLRETGLEADWRDRLSWGSENLVAQVELWYRRSEEDRRRQVEALRRRLGREGGRLIGQAVEIPSIAYHAQLVEVPRAVAESLLAGDEVELVKAEEVMFLRPLAQVALPGGDRAPAPEEAPPVPGAAPGADPIVALFDGMPFVGHQQLRGRLLVDDPDGSDAAVPAADRLHGTAMASLILHGDLSAAGPPLPRPLYVRPLLRPTDTGAEEFPENELYVDLLHRAVRRLFEGEGDEPAVAPGVVVVNLSIGDRWRPYEGLVSPAARLLDWLAWKHGVLFVVSAGNAGAELDLGLDCTREEFNRLSAEEMQRLVWRCIHSQAHLRRLFAPAEAVNALTAGAEHADAAGTYPTDGRLDPFAASEHRQRLPSPVSAVGTGVARSIKPEVFLPGGRWLYQLRHGIATDPARLSGVGRARHPPGHKVAAPGEPGVSTAVRYTAGTSNSAALATRAAALLYDRLPVLLPDGWQGGGPSRHFQVALLKAFLVHSTSWGSGQDVIEPVLGEVDQNILKARLGRYLGYGFIDPLRMDGCTEERATMAAWDEIGSEDGHLYRIPLPASLSGQPVRRRLTMTLAYLTPINPFDKRYRKAQVWLTLRDEEEDLETAKVLRVSRREAQWQAVTRGTVQHEILEGEKPAGFGEDGEVVVKVNCRPHAGSLDAPIPYALLVSLEVAPGTGIPVYQEVRARLRARVAVRPESV
jgi:subtilisin family serine protease